MTPLLPTSSWRRARVASAALALTAATLSVSGPALGQGAFQPSLVAADVAAAAPCLTNGSSHRVRADSGLDGVDPNDVTLAQTQRLEAKLAARSRQRGVSTERATLGRTTVDVYVHVITKNNGSGNVSNKRIADQIAVLNKSYAGQSTSSAAKTAFTFKLKHTDRTAKSAWYDWDPPTDTSLGDDLGPKKALHKGGMDDLNLYLAAIDDGVLGYSSFPFDTTLAQDGVVVLNDTLPGGSATGYNKGDTATHEVGHWLGLYHTFENGCSGTGDEVADTPAQADGTNVFSCNAALDTCPAAGRDPVHNFMSYGDDKCLNRFTAGQAERMAQIWLAYRAPGAGG